MHPESLRTERLMLRQWTEHDREPFAAMNADPTVMRFFPSTLSRAESDSFVDRIEQSFATVHYGLWAVEITASREFAGYVGLWPATFDAHFTPAIEIGWRLAERYWGHGYAPEAAHLVINDGFNRLGLAEIVSFTTASNHPSRRVMEKIGMTCDPADNFDHPDVPADDPLRPHVLYRIAAHGLVSKGASR